VKDYTLKSMLGLIGQQKQQNTIIKAYTPPELTPMEVAEAQAIYQRPQKSPDTPPPMPPKKKGWGAA
jgi:hypothetical protein